MSIHLRGDPTRFSQLPPDLDGAAAQLACELERLPLDDAVVLDDHEARPFGAVEDRRAALDPVFLEPPQRGDLQVSEVQSMAPWSSGVYSGVIGSMSGERMLIGRRFIAKGCSAAGQRTQAAQQRFNVANP